MDHLFFSGAYSTGNASVAWLGLMLGFFFLLRASEYLPQKNREWSAERVLKGENLAGRLSNQPAKFTKAEELVIEITGSKTDQYNVGAVRNHFRSQENVCPVLAAELYERHFPQRLHGSEKHMALMRWTDGEPMVREDIQHLLTLAAIAVGVDPARMGSHSLRIGGATAMYHMNHDLEYVKRFGRWKSDCFHRYLWEAHEPPKGIATLMARDRSQLTAPL
jgi:hypothetical protein